MDTNLFEQSSPWSYSEKSREFQDIFELLGIDKNVLYLIKVEKDFYLFPEKEFAARLCKSKRLMSRFLCLTAVARPIYNLYWKRQFEDRIVMYPFKTQEPYSRNSKRCSSKIMPTIAYKVNWPRHIEFLAGNIFQAIDC